jgi:hypothetical protein
MTELFDSIFHNFLLTRPFSSPLQNNGSSLRGSDQNRRALPFSRFSDRQADGFGSGRGGGSSTGAATAYDGGLSYVETNGTGGGYGSGSGSTSSGGTLISSIGKAGGSGNAATITEAFGVGGPAFASTSGDGSGGGNGGGFGGFLGLKNGFSIAGFGTGSRNNNGNSDNNKKNKDKEENYYYYYTEPVYVPPTAEYARAGGDGAGYADTIVDGYGADYATGSAYGKGDSNGYGYGTGYTDIVVGNDQVSGGGGGNGFGNTAGTGVASMNSDFSFQGDGGGYSAGGGSGTLGGTLSDLASSP